MSKDLLDILWGEDKSYGEIRAIKDGKVNQHFYEWPSDKALLKTDVEKLAQDHDVYFGVAPRVTKGGKASDVAPLLYWVWADVDKKSGATFDSLLLSQLPPPQIVVDSGYGWHLYWRMRNPMPHEHAQKLMQGIAHSVGGDAVGDAPRILRLPGTFNYKGNPLPVRVLRMRNLDQKWRVGDFDVDLSAEPTVGGSYTGGKGNKGTRSEDLFKYALNQIKDGATDEEIYAGMLVLPAGEKIREMTQANADRWVARTLKKARKGNG